MSELYSRSLIKLELDQVLRLLAECAGSAAGKAAFYFSESWITLLTKAVYGLVAGLIAWSGGKKGASYARNQIASIAAALAYAFVYLFKNFAYNGLLLGGLTLSASLDLAALKIPATIFNAVLPMIFTPILARAIRAGLDRSGIRL